MLKVMESRMKSLWSASQSNGLEKVVNQFKSSALIISFLMAFSWQPVAHAQEVDVATLTPIINFLLDEQEEDAIECPSLGFVPEVVIEDGILVSFGPAEGQNIEGDVFVTSQQGLDQLSGVVRINGDLTISIQSFSQPVGLSPLLNLSPDVDFSPLDLLSEVTGAVLIQTESANFDELNCLANVGGDFNILGNDILSIDGFKSLESVSGDFNIIGNDALEEIDGFKSLESVSGSLVLLGNEVLESINGFRSLESVGQDITIAGNTRLQSINGFQSLESVGNSFVVSSNQALRDVSGFNSLNSVGRILQISFNSGLELISGFQLLRSIGNDFNIFNNDSLRSFSGFSSLESIGLNLNISNNATLEGIGSLAALERNDVSGNIFILSNALFDCGLPVPNFSVATFSSGNAINCPQDSDSRTVRFSSNESAVIPDLGNVSSSITVLAQPSTVGTVRSLEVNLDIEHTSVGDLTVTLSNGTTTINLLDRPGTLLNASGISAEIANQCTQSPVFTTTGTFGVTNIPGDDFSATDLEEFISGSNNNPGGTTVAGFIGTGSFVSLDAGCVFDLLNASNDDDAGAILAEIASQCIDSAVEDAFLEIESSGELFNDFQPIDADCAFGVLGALEGIDSSINPDDVISEDLLSIVVAQCTEGQFPEDDFLNEIRGNGIFDVDGFASFPTIDVDCVSEILANLEEEVGGSQFCSSNNISVRLSDDISLRPLNTSCSTDNSAEAFVLPSYVPLESLGAFEGSSAFGTWTLTVTDSEGGNTGVLNSWGIVFNLER